MRFFSIGLLGCFVASICHADVSFIDGFPAKLTISKEIKAGDLKKVSAYISDKPSKGNLPSVIVYLNSVGGDVNEAMAIGMRLREFQTMTIVDSKASCVSSCVLILASGVQRSVSGKVGIHRPYIGNDKAITEVEQKANYLKIEKYVKDYLSYMNINTSLYDVMFRIPPEKVRFLNDRELQDFGLNEADPYWWEAGEARSAESLGLTKRQWVAVRSSCLKNGPNSQYEQCKESVLKGLK